LINPFLLNKTVKGMIRIPQKVKIPEGTKVIIKIEPALRSAEKRKIISSLCGAWSDDATIATIFEEIEYERHQYHGKEVRFA
jgi:predicted DNA-binding antitoxin AbrB/MazE fold protein